MATHDVMSGAPSSGWASGGWVHDWRRALPILICTAALPTALLFIRFVYALTFGYGGALFAIGMLLMGARGADSGPGFKLVDLHIVLLIAYGLRYFALMTWRETHYAEFTRQYAVTEANRWPHRLRTLVVCSVLYALEASPALFNLQACSARPDQCHDDVFQAIALFIATLGLALETVADWQKAADKQMQRAQTPRTDSSPGEAPSTTFITSGLFTRCRHPNYAADLLFWTGFYAAGLPAIARASRWEAAAKLLLSSIGLLSEIVIMHSRLVYVEASQLVKYGHLPAYREYLSRSHALVPAWTKVKAS